MSEKVSVIITVLNEADSIHLILQNLISQTRKPDEIVIVDGGSTDGTDDIISNKANTETSIRLYVQKGTNISQGRNIAINKARFPLIAVTDGGCRPDNKWLEKLIEPLAKDPSVEGCGLPPFQQE